MRSLAEPRALWVWNGSVDHALSTRHHRALVAPRREDFHLGFRGAFPHGDTRTRQQEVVRLANVVLLDEGGDGLVVPETGIEHADRRARLSKILDQDTGWNHALLDPRPHAPDQRWIAQRGGTEHGRGLGIQHGLTRACVVELESHACEVSLVT